MNLIITALLLSFASAPAGLRAQPGQPWTIESGPRSSQVNESTARGYAALPASVLVSVGAEVSYARDGVVVQVGSHQVAVANGAAQVTVDGTARPLAHAVYAEGGVVFLPVDFFRELLPGLTEGRVRVNVAGRTIRGSAARPVGTVAVAEDEATPPAAEPAPEPAPVRPAQRKLVVVDAGHGGRDPGARGPGGTREKDVTLRVARMVAELLRQDPTLEVRMTRDRDTLIALHDRARFANRWRDQGQPAVFISIHCNANESRYEKGYETYFLSEARTADARRVEAFENASVQYEEHAAGRDALGFILTDLRQNHYLRESSEWAQIIQDHLRAIHPGPNRGVKQAGFAVLRGTFMPSVLVEIGFVSNHNEERLLVDEQMQASIARQLAESVRSYFNRPGVRPTSE